MKFITQVFLYSFPALILACGNRPMQGTAATVKNAADTGFNLRVLCYNIHHANPPSRPGFIDLEAIAIMPLSATIITLSIQYRCFSASMAVGNVWPS